MSIKAILKTKKNAIISVHNDEKENNKKTTKYLCGHVFRIASEIKKEKKNNLKYNGFIHISKEAKEEQYFDVLGIIMKGFIEKLSYKKNISIMISGFTKFNYVIDNPTSRFLFNDGVSENYGLMNADIKKIDSILENEFDKSIKKLEPIFKIINRKKIEIGYSYLYQNSKIDIIFLRLPVDDDLTNTEAYNQDLIDNNGKVFSTITNNIGDSTGLILKKAINLVKPDALISFGSSSNKVNEYTIETVAYGMLDKGAIYNSSDEYIVNDDLLKIISFH